MREVEQGHQGQEPGANRRARARYVVTGARFTCFTSTKVQILTVLSQLGTLERDAKQLGQDFLALEKFVNLNYQAFEKLLKNHDRCLVYLLY